MTAIQLLVLIGILAVARGVFFLLPQLHVKSVWLKLALVICLGAAGYYFLRPDVLERIPHPAKIVILVFLFLGILIGIPRGTLDEQQKKTLLEYMDSIIIAGVTALVLIAYVVRSFYIPSESMEKTLMVNDMILVDELCYRFYSPGRDDVVVFIPPPKAHSGGKDYIKRVIAVGGETVAVKNDQVFINGKPIQEPYKFVDPNSETRPIDEEPVTVPPGDVFVMGDNRHNSDDSRDWGFLPVKNIIGKAFLIFYPLNRIRLLH